MNIIMEKFDAVLFHLPRVLALGKWVYLDGKVHPAEEKCSCFSFSDTFVLSTNDSSTESYNNIIIATFLLARNLFGVGLPVRGAITKGEADYIPKTQHLIGKAIIEAARLEKLQDWFGVILSPDILSADDTIPSDPIGKALLRYPVPLKDGLKVDFVVINWRLNLIAEYGTKSLFSKPSDPNQFKKIMNTLKFAKYVRDSNQAYLKEVTEKWQHRVRIPGKLGQHSATRFGHGDDY